MLLSRALRLPLELKLLGPNLVVIALALGALAGSISEYVVIAILLAGAAINFVLVRFALKPVKAMQLVAEQVSEGQLDARVQPSIIADAGLARLAVTFNETLEYLGAAQEAIRQSGARIVYAQEQERSRVARELHDSIGQTLAAASFQAAAASSATAGRDAQEHTIEVSRLLRAAMDEIRNVSRELHPRVADDLGLPAALESLTRSTMDRSLIKVELSVKGFHEPVSSPIASTLYRITREALHNIERSADSGTVTISLSSEDGEIQLEINDNCHFDGVIWKTVHASLAASAERLSLLGGKLVIESNFIGGTHIVARIKRQLEAA